MDWNTKKEPICKTVWCPDDGWLKWDRFLGHYVPMNWEVTEVSADVVEKKTEAEAVNLVMPAFNLIEQR